MAGPAQSRLLVATAAPPTRHQRHTLGSSSLLLLVAYWLRLRLLPPTPSPARSSRLFFHQVPSCFALPFFCCYPFVLSFFFHLPGRLEFRFVVPFSKVFTAYPFFFWLPSFFSTECLPGFRCFHDHPFLCLFKATIFFEISNTLIDFN